MKQEKYLACDLESERGRQREREGRERESGGRERGRKRMNIFVVGASYTKEYKFLKGTEKTTITLTNISTLPLKLAQIVRAQLVNNEFYS